MKKQEFTNIQKERIKVLISELRSGKYIKITGQLKDGPNHFCFWGLATQVYMNRTKNGRFSWSAQNSLIDGNGAGYIWTTTTPSVIDEYFGLDFDSMVGKSDGGWSFKRIANYLEKLIS